VDVRLARNVEVETARDDLLARWAVTADREATPQRLNECDAERVSGCLMYLMDIGCRLNHFAFLAGRHGRTFAGAGSSPCGSSTGSASLSRS
jgi:hypothetical protein